MSRDRPSGAARLQTSGSHATMLFLAALSLSSARKLMLPFRAPVLVPHPFECAARGSCPRMQRERERERDENKDHYLHLFRALHFRSDDASQRARDSSAASGAQTKTPKLVFFFFFLLFSDTTLRSVIESVGRLRAQIIKSIIYHTDTRKVSLSCASICQLSRPLDGLISLNGSLARDAHNCDRLGRCD